MSPLIIAVLVVATAGADPSPRRSAPPVPMADAVAPNSPEAFVRRLYAVFKDGPGHNPPDWTGRVAGQYFDAEMVALFKRDRATTPRGDVGLIEADPICDCQDWGKLTVESVELTAPNANQAQATVAFTNFGDHFVMKYDLVNVGGQWRIHDIQTKDTPSLRKFLIDGLAERRAGKPR